MTAIARPRPSTATPDLAAEMRQFRAEVMAELQVIRALVEQGRGARDDADAALVVALMDVFRDRAFTSAHALALAGARETLADALQGADVTSPRELGHVLRRVEGIPIQGRRIVRDAAHRDGIVWRGELCEL